MSETRLPELDVDPVSRRLRRIVDAKREENEAALGALDRLEANWEDSNKEIDQEINTEFEFMALEQQAADEAVRDLGEQRAKPIADAFVIAGKVLEQKEQVGLPGMLVRVETSIRNNPMLLAKARTNHLGSFVAAIGKKELEALDENRRSLSLAVYSDPKTLVHTVDRAMTLKAGRVEHVTLAVRQVDDLSDRLAAGKAVRDSVHSNAAVLSARTDNMRDSHTALAKLAKRSRAELKALREDLAAAPPRVPATAAPGPPESERPDRRATRYLGNAGSRELHDLTNEQPSCQIDEIRSDHRVPFDDVESAVEAGYDFCAYCFGRERSKR